jgi:phage replication-related protein YjqB (UPF0714/DUF867 family)
MTHASFRDLLAADGVVEECHLRGKVGFMAYHGGGLEEMTDVIARAAAAASECSYYAVLQPDHLKWHIPSHKVSAEESPALQRFIDHVDVVITVHGYGRNNMWTTLLLGGQNRSFADHVADHLRPALPDYVVETRLHEMPRELRGLHHRNPVNLPRQQGVQIELPPRVRGRSPIWSEWPPDRLTPHTEALIDGLAAAAGNWSS